MSFVHLHVHSQYSLLEATCKIKSIVKKAAEWKQPAVALTDNGNMFGAVEFYFAAQEAGVKPILGMDVYYTSKSRLVKGEDKDVQKEPYRRLVLLAQDLEGYKNLCRLSSIGFQEGFYYKPRIDEEVLKQFSKNLICLTGGSRGIVPIEFSQFGEERALEKVRWLKDIFQDRLYLELNRTGVGDWALLNKFYQEAGRICEVPVVAANDVFYVEPADSFAQEVLICIGSNKTLQDESRFKLGSQEFYLKSSEQMRGLFKDIPEACDKTLEIAERCNVKFKLKDENGKPIYHLPSFQNGDLSPKDQMVQFSHAGLRERIKELEAQGEKFDPEKIEAYKKRLDYELEVIDRMGFNGYFLIVQDFINWAKANQIPVGPGRGSGAGSLVAYSLKITDLDPIANALIFERFLNPERISMPDFDIDFCQDRRGEVIDYVTQKYGAACVSQIITFGKLQARAAVRDVGRVLGMSFSEVDVISKLIPEKLGISLKEAIEMEPRLRNLMEDEPKIATLMDLSQRIEGLTRHASIHAAGVIISDKALVEHAPLYRGENGENVVQYDMKYSEKIGLIKFDFLGLKTLTLIDDALKMIAKNKGVQLTTSDILMTDPQIYEIMSEGNTAGIFQFEGDGISDLITKVRPSSFQDITAINALYRPGPMQMLDEYIGRKHGTIKVEYLFPELEEVLKETYGIIVYQEQVQLIAAKIASYSLGEADVLRRAMGKKIPEEMAKQKTRFLEGAAKNNFDAKKSEELFDQMAKFAEYGFNKSHAAAYCVVAAQTAWLKAKYPVEFYAAMLSTEMSDTDKIVKYVKDARYHGVDVRAPHVSFSDYKFSVNGESIYYGLGGIKGVGEAAVQAILEAREGLEGKVFKTLDDFFENVDLRRVNKKVIECLIKAGALDELGATRATLMSGYALYVDRAEILRADREVGQVSLFSMDEESKDDQVKLPVAKPWGRGAQLAYEKEVLGFYLSSHPLQGMGGVLRPWITCEIANLKNIEIGEPKVSKESFRKESGKKVVVGGIISSFREIITKKGTRMAFGQLEDMSDSVELVIFPDAYAKIETLVKQDQPVLVEGSLQREEGSSKIMVDNMSLVQQKVKSAKSLTFHIQPDSEIEFDSLRSILEKSPGTTTLQIKLHMPQEKRSVLMKLSEPVGIEASSQIIEEIYSVLGKSDTLEVGL